MKTLSSIKTACFAAIFIIIGSTTVNAQSQYINIKSIESASGTTWIGSREINYTKVNLEWEIAAAINVSNFEVEYSFDMVNFISAGKVKHAIAENEQSKTYSFEHTSKELTGKPIVQYRIKQTDVFGTITYSEPKKTSVKS